MSEITELLEEAKRNLFQCNATKLIDQALALLKQQPPAGEFTKMVRKDIKDTTPNLYASIIWEACDRLDRSEASKAELLAACETAKRFIRNGIELGYIKMPEIETDPAHKTLPKIEAAVAKAKKEG